MRWWTRHKTRKQLPRELVSKLESLGVMDIRVTEGIITAAQEIKSCGQQCELVPCESDLEGGFEVGVIPDPRYIEEWDAYFKSANSLADRLQEWQNDWTKANYHAQMGEYSTYSDKQWLAENPQPSTLPRPKSVVRAFVTFRVSDVRDVKAIGG